MSMKTFHIMGKPYGPICNSQLHLLLLPRGGRSISIGDVIGPEKARVDAMQTLPVDTKTPYGVHSEARLVGRESCPCPQFHLFDVAAWIDVDSLADVDCSLSLLLFC